MVTGDGTVVEWIVVSTNSLHITSYTDGLRNLRAFAVLLRERQRARPRRDVVVSYLGGMLIPRMHIAGRLRRAVDE